jgi:hypothetical protein
MPLQEHVEDPTLCGAPTNSQFECCQRLPLPRFMSCLLFRGMVRNRIPRVCSYFCSTEQNSELFSIPLKGLEGNSESLLFRGMIRNEIPRVCSYFCSTERNSELFFLPLKGSEWNSEGSLLFLVYGTEFRVVFSSAEGFGTEFREFLFRGTVGIPSKITICSVNSFFRGIIFLSEIPNPIHNKSFQITLTIHATFGVSAKH